jgi:multiple sugar transport system ATP-binding protein
MFVFERVIDVVEPPRPDTMLVFTLGGREAIARVRPEDRAPGRTPYRSEVDMHKAKLFDAATGLRL